jgi:hypothetical protein
VQGRPVVTAAVIERTDLPQADEAGFDSWLDKGRALAGDLQSAVAGRLWVIGDWWASGEHAYGERAKAGALLFKGILSYGSLRNAASVARRVELSRRRDSLPFWTHHEVAHLEPAEQGKYLAIAADEKLSASKLRWRIDADRAAAEAAESVRERMPAGGDIAPEFDAEIQEAIKREVADRGELTKRVKAAGFDGGWIGGMVQQYQVLPPPVFASCNGGALRMFIEAGMLDKIAAQCQAWRAGDGWAVPEPGIVDAELVPEAEPEIADSETVALAQTAIGAACVRCAELEAECVRLSERGAEQYNELERIHDSYKAAREDASIKLASARAQVRKLEADLASARERISALEADRRPTRMDSDPIGLAFPLFDGKSSTGAVYDAKTSKLLNLAIDTASEPEAALALRSARAAHRKASGKDLSLDVPF